MCWIDIATYETLGLEFQFLILRLVQVVVSLFNHNNFIRKTTIFLVKCSWYKVYRLAIRI